MPTQKNKIPFRVEPMLAKLEDRPFHRNDWVYEEKYDGHRILAYKEGSEITLLSRNAKDRNHNFPKIVAAIKSLKPSTLLLDGEAVIFDKDSVSRFGLLQRSEGAATYVVFDCLFWNGHDLRGEPLSTRRTVLETLAKQNKVLRDGKLLMLSRKLAENGLKAFEIAKRKGYEGLVAKDLTSRYSEKRSGSWLKVKANQQDEFIIAGFTAPAGSREYFGALLLGAYRDKKLHYVGKVGTGFGHETLMELAKKFSPIRRARPAFIDPPRMQATYLEPQLVAQISYTEWTGDMKLRHPVYLGLREDKDASQVTFPQEAK